MAKRKNEKFKRIKCSTLAKMLQENNYEESIYNINNADSATMVNGENMEPCNEESKMPDETESIYSVQTGVTQVSAVTYATDQLGITSDSKFLLLDLRDPEDYTLWRIKEALSFPAPNIARDKLIPELFRFKNKPDKFVIIYMQDERKGTQFAQLFFEKGYENIYLLSGGIEQFLEEFPDLVEGRNVPVPKKLIEAEEEQKRA